MPIILPNNSDFLSNNRPKLIPVSIYAEISSNCLPLISGKRLLPSTLLFLDNFKISSNVGKISTCLTKSEIILCDVML